jgi:hypothetical protein
MCPPQSFSEIMELADNFRKFARTASSFTYAEKHGRRNPQVVASNVVPMRLCEFLLLKKLN